MDDIGSSATDSNFVNLPSESVMVDAHKMTVTFMANGEIYKTVRVYYGGELKEIPPIPAKKDARDRTYTGVWYSDEQGTPADMTVYAVYTAYYTVPIEGGTGYTLTAESGSTSPVLEGSSFTIKFTLSNDYHRKRKHHRRWRHHHRKCTGSGRCRDRRPDGRADDWQNKKENQ